MCLLRAEGFLRAFARVFVCSSRAGTVTKYLAVAMGSAQEGAESMLQEQYNQSMTLEGMWTWGVQTALRSSSISQHSQALNSSRIRVQLVVVGFDDSNSNTTQSGQTTAAGTSGVGKTFKIIFIFIEVENKQVCK